MAGVVVTSSERQRAFLIALGLVLVTAIAYLRVPSLQFLTSYDDALYVTGNATVQRGLTWEGVVWAFTTDHAANWHPLTWLSHMLDVGLFGVNPAAHHAMNLLLHILNVLLLFNLLHVMTGRLGAAAAVAAIWAVHPLHVESVAWVSERKDVLSALFFLLALRAYNAYARAETRGAPGMGAYIAALVFAALGLMAKPMLVTLPCVLLLLDYWPLKRFVPRATSRRAAAVLVADKVPFFGLAALSSIATIYAQRHAGAVRELTDLPLDFRVANAAVAYVQYLGKTYFPIELAAIYPHPGSQLSLAFGISAAVFLVLTTAVFLVLARPMPYLIVGWLWFLGTLTPVIGLVQVGSQAMADRYTYIPHMGLFIALVWTVSALIPRRSRAATALTIGITVMLAGATYRQTGRWSDGVTLFNHTVAVTGPNPLARINLGTAYLDAGNALAALEQFDEAARLDPDLVLAHYNRGVALRELGRLPEAHTALARTLELDPAHAEAHNNIGMVFLELGQDAVAAASFRSAIELEPELVEAHVNLGAVLARQDDPEGAEAVYRDVLTFAPENVQARINLGNLCARTGRPEEARRWFDEALARDPTSDLAHFNFAVLLKQIGDEEAAQYHLNEANRLRKPR